MDVAVIKLGVGNTASVMFALERLGARAVLTDEPAVVNEAPRVILPGVGAAAHAMRLLDQKGLRKPLKDFARPLLGICLGQQLLYTRSEEGDAAGLGRIAGNVAALSPAPDRPIPHMGWTSIELERDDPLTEGLESGAYFYFVHSYACPIGPETLARAEYGRVFSAMVRSGAAYGCQFHPERSGGAGARVLANFLALPC